MEGGQTLPEAVEGGQRPAFPPPVAPAGGSGGLEGVEGWREEHGKGREGGLAWHISQGRRSGGS